MFRLKYLQLVQIMRNSDEIVAIGSECTCFRWNRYHWFRICIFHLNRMVQFVENICVFQLKQFQFALTMHILVELVVIGSDYACFT